MITIILKFIGEYSPAYALTLQTISNNNNNDKNNTNTKITQKWMKVFRGLMQPDVLFPCYDC